MHAEMEKLKVSQKDLAKAVEKDKEAMFREHRTQRAVIRGLGADAFIRHMDDEKEIRKHFQRLRGDVLAALPEMVKAAVDKHNNRGLPPRKRHSGSVNY